ncbi:MAG: 50S ribosome-binding GTPase, partial [Clostridia bacterium]|nr:50S ribosome-binding GTPase [Clostridia bacterium]
RSIDEDVESYSVMRSLLAIRRADVVLVVLDASEPVSEQDVKIAGYVHEQGKPTVVVMNKWDTIEKDTFTVEKYNKDLAVALSFMDYYTPLYISAKTGKRVEKVMGEVKRVYENASRKVPTGLLNDVIGDAVSVNEPPSYKGRRLKITYATQISTNPPSFAIFVNDRELMHFSYKRYLENTLRKSFDFSGTPIKLSIRNKNEDE